jgi:hypothetical protein
VRRDGSRVRCFTRNGHAARPAADQERKRRLAKLIGKAKRRAIRYNEHVTGNGPTVFGHGCAWGWRASCRSGRTRLIAAARRRCGSSQRIRRARQCIGNARRSGRWSRRPSRCRQLMVSRTAVTARDGAESGLSPGRQPEGSPPAPSLPPPITAGADSELDKTWGQGHRSRRRPLFSC